MSQDRQESTELGHRYHRLSVVGNVLLAAMKLGVGALAGSQALIADGLHSLADVALSGAAWVGYRWSRSPPDEDHHYGHGSGEALAGLLVGLVVVSTGAGLAWAAFSWHATVHADARGVAALAVLGLTLATKLWLAGVVGRAGAALHSPSLVAVGRDHRGDVYASALVLVAVAASLLGLGWAEPVATLLLGVLVARMGIQSVAEGFDVLMDRVADPEFRGRIAETARGVEGVHGVERVRIHPLGGSFRIDMEVSVDGAVSVAEGHRIAHRVEQAVVAAHEQIEGVLVHVNPD